MIWNLEGTVEKFWEILFYGPFLLLKSWVRLVLGLLSGYECIAFSNHLFNDLFWNGPVQNQGIPVFFVLVVGGNYRWVGIPPEIPPFRINFYIYPDVSIPFIGPGKGPFIFPVPDQYPVRVVKWGVLIGVRKCKCIF